MYKQQMSINLKNKTKQNCELAIMPSFPFLLLKVQNSGLALYFIL